MWGRFFRQQANIGITWSCMRWYVKNLYSKFSFGEVCRRINGWKLSFTATRKRSYKTWFRNVYPTIYLPKWKFWCGYPHSNELLTFFLQKDSEKVFCCTYTSSGCQLHKTAWQLLIFTCQPMKSDVTLRHTVANLWRYPIRRRVAFASTLEFVFT